MELLSDQNIKREQQSIINLYFTKNDSTTAILPEPPSYILKFNFLKNCVDIDCGIPPSLWQNTVSIVKVWATPKYQPEECKGDVGQEKILLSKVAGPAGGLSLELSANQHGKRSLNF